MAEARAMTGNPQLPLGLALQDSARFDSYFPGLNREAVQQLQLAASGKGEKLVYVAGARGVGKTHLLQAACHSASQCDRTSAYLPLQELAGACAHHPGRPGTAGPDLSG